MIEIGGKDGRERERWACEITRQRKVERNTERERDWTGRRSRTERSKAAKKYRWPGNLARNRKNAVSRLNKGKRTETIF